MGGLTVSLELGKSYRPQNWKYSPLEGATGYGEAIQRLMAPSFNKGFLVRISLLYSLEIETLQVT